MYPISIKSRAQVEFLERQTPRGEHALDASVFVQGTNYALSSLEWDLIEYKGRSEEFWKQVFEEWRASLKEFIGRRASEFYIGGETFSMSQVEDGKLLGLGRGTKKDTLVWIEGSILKMESGRRARVLTVSIPFEGNTKPRYDGLRPASDKAAALSEL